MKSNKLITIIGPTAIGKTALSIQLAQHFQTEILSRRITSCKTPLYSK
jgi:tRNA dimethylallyltransferase